MADDGSLQHPQLPDVSDAHLESKDAATTASQSRRRQPPNELPPPIPPPPFPGLPQHILLIYNVSKSSNIGPLIRTAIAFSCAAIVVVGARKLLTHGNKHTNRFVTWRHYDRLIDAVTHLRSQSFTLVGLELSHTAVELSAQPTVFTARTCFIPGNEGSGLSSHVLPHIDRLVYIRQSGHGTASLNVSTATGIVLYAFQMWAQYPEQSREEDERGEAGLAKYRVDEEKAHGSGGWKIPRHQHQTTQQQHADNVQHVDSASGQQQTAEERPDGRAEQEVKHDRESEQERLADESVNDTSTAEPPEFEQSIHTNT